jgi:hypothetical protein
LNRSLGGCGVGDAEALRSADALLLRAGLLRGGVLVGALLAGGGVLEGGLLVDGGVVIVVEGAIVVEGGLLAPLPTAAATGVSSLAGSS